MADSITLTGIAVHANHGVFDFERENGQTFIVDVTVWLDLGPAASGDALLATVHYGELAEAVYAAVAANPVDLIETVAERVARVALEFAGVERVRATVHKPDAPISVPFADVAVTVERDRAWFEAGDADAVDADLRRASAPSATGPGDADAAGEASA